MFIRSIRAVLNYTDIIHCGEIMPRGYPLSRFEQGQIIAYRDSGMNLRGISDKLNRSVKVVHSFLLSPTQYTRKKKRGITRKISDKAKRRLLRVASNNVASASNMQRALELNVSVRRVQQILRASPHLTYRKIIREPWTNERHYQERINWAIGHVAWKCQWNNVIFSDEKKFNLDGPDGLMYYWRDVRKKPLRCHRRAFGGGSLMVWGGISTNGKTRLAILEGKQTAHSYVKTLEEFLLPSIEENRMQSTIFQQDNAAIHTAHLTRSWLLFRNIKVMQWPAHSPDLNPIENVWGLLARRVYAEARVFHSTQELKASILHEWENFEISIVQNLITSMSHRCIGVIKNNGRCI
jgi:hypothetical protein